MKWLLDIGRRYLSKGSFVQNFAVVFGGKSVIFLFGFLLTPIIARIYTPEAYGTYALYNAFVLAISVFVNLRLPTSFVMIENETIFKEVCQAATGLILFFTILIAFFFGFFDTYVFSTFEDKTLIGKWYLITIGVFLSATTDLLGNWNVRERAFAKSSQISISESLVTKLSSLGIGVFTYGSLYGLILGEFCGKGVHLLMQKKIFISNRLGYIKPEVNLKHLRRVLITNKEYPLLVAPSVLITQLSGTLIIFYLSALYSPDLVGKFGMAYGLLMMPVGLIANASQPVLTQKIVEIKGNKEHMNNAVSSFILVLVLTFSIIAPIAMLTVESLIIIFLGENWKDSGLLIAWMMPLVLPLVLFNPLTGVLIALKKNRTILLVNVSRFVITACTLAILPLISTDFHSGMRWYVLGAGIALILPIGYILSILRLKITWKVLVSFGAYILVCSVCFWLLSFFRIEF